jgi:thioredoxin-related protein
MRLKQKQFVPFIIAIAVISMIFIAYSSFRFQDKQLRIFHEKLVESDSLLIMPLRVLSAGDSVTISEQKGKNMVMLFWASWSDKSKAMMNEIQKVQHEQDSLVVIAGLIKDAEESLPGNKEYPDFIYVDGSHLYNHLMVPGFPSYIVLDKKGKVLGSKIGYEEGVGYDSLKAFLP